MKIRIQSDSIRFRLTRSEVDDLGAGRTVCDKIHFSLMDELEFSIHPWLLNVTEAKLDQHKIVISVPQANLLQWSSGNDEGISVVIDNGADGLRVLIEKDYECIGRDHENAVLFPNPKSQC